MVVRNVLTRIASTCSNRMFQNGPNSFDAQRSGLSDLNYSFVSNNSSSFAQYPSVYTNNVVASGETNDNQRLLSYLISKLSNNFGIKSLK